MKMLITVLLFVILSPGLLLNIPGITYSGNFWDLSFEGKGYFQTHQTSFISILVHALVFGVACWLLQGSLEKFDALMFGHVSNDFQNLDRVKKEYVRILNNFLADPYTPQMANPATAVPITNDLQNAINKIMMSNDLGEANLIFNDASYKAGLNN